ncbi:acetyltransferase, GNAT [Candidatus Vecturithrix granuli]|uniref:Acetyltransferase, GNAT n=1 Tax=Vecturithrix granuli TaxID=1499967 RepID=A0A081BXE5_VECG1|nr:acetyltransferase, GNAT [Candidatus Vecturithrix granuli]
MKSTNALVIIDAQVNMFDDQMPVFDGDRVLMRLTQLIEQARSARIPVIFIRNNGIEGDPDEPGTAGWQIHPALSPRSENLVIDKDTPDSFDRTNLQEALHAQGIKHLIVAGMQTEMCINTTCLRAKELGYEVTLVADAHSTFDMKDMTAEQVILHYNTTLRAIAEIKTAKEVVFS